MSIINHKKHNMEVAQKTDYKVLEGLKDVKKFIELTGGKVPIGRIFKKLGTPYYAQLPGLMIKKGLVERKGHANYKWVGGTPTIHTATALTNILRVVTNTSNKVATTPKEEKQPTVNTGKIKCIEGKIGWFKFKVYPTYS